MNSELDELGSAFEIVPLAILPKMAAADPIFKNYTRPENDTNKVTAIVDDLFRLPKKTAGV